MSTRMQSTLVAVFDRMSNAQAAASELKREGFDDEDIYISQEPSMGANMGTNQGTASTVSTETIGLGASHHEGGITGWFKSLFGSDGEHTDRSRYENAVTSGHVLLSVDASAEDTDAAADILDRHSPIDIHREVIGDEAPLATPSTKAATPMPAVAQAKMPAASGTDAIQVVQEELQVGKRSVQRGGIRVYSRVLETPVEESVELREEHVRVERLPVNRAATEADFRSGAGQTIEVQEYAEEAVVGKQARVVEEVRVGKQVDERTETIRDTVRHTEVEVEELGGSAKREATSTNPATPLRGTTTGGGTDR